MSRPTMRAVRLDVGTGDHALVDVPRARPAAGEVLVRVGAAAVGRFDLDLLGGRMTTAVPGRTRIVPGHEVAGFVAAPGVGVDGWPLNRRVAVHPVLTTPPAAREGGAELLLGLDVDGGWAAYVSAPAANLVPLPPAVGLEEAAVLAGTVATAWSALTGPAGPRPGESVAVWGTGALGLPAVQLARFVGAAPVLVVGPAGAARDRAMQAGADLALDPGSETFGSELAAQLPGGPDVVLETSGDPRSVEQALAVVRAGGRAILLRPAPTPMITEDAASARRACQIVLHVGSRRRDLAQLVRLVELGRLDVSASVGPVRSLEDAAEVVAALEPDAAARPVLRPDPAPSRY